MTSPLNFRASTLNPVTAAGGTPMRFRAPVSSASWPLPPIASPSRLRFRVGLLDGHWSATRGHWSLLALEDRSFRALNPETVATVLRKGNARLRRKMRRAIEREWQQTSPR